MTIDRMNRSLIFSYSLQMSPPSSHSLLLPPGSSLNSSLNNSNSSSSGNNNQLLPAGVGAGATAAMSQHKRSLSFNHHLSYNQYTPTQPQPHLLHPPQPPSLPSHLGAIGHKSNLVPIPNSKTAVAAPSATDVSNQAAIQAAVAAAAAAAAVAATTAAAATSAAPSARKGSTKGM